MSSNEGWFERNQAVLDFAANLAAIKQRSVVIQQQLNTNALLSQQTDFDEQRRETEERERDSRNILYDINQAAALISKEYQSNPQLACYKAILLKDQVDEIQLNHKWFSDLQWKDYCTQTCTALADLVTYADAILPAEEISGIRDKVRSEKLLARATYNRLPNPYSPNSISIDLSTVDVKRLDKFMARFDKIWKASTDGNTRMYTFINPTAKKEFEIVLERDFIRSKPESNLPAVVAVCVGILILAVLIYWWT